MTPHVTITDAELDHIEQTLLLEVTRVMMILRETRRALKEEQAHHRLNHNCHESLYVI